MLIMRFARHPAHRRMHYGQFISIHRAELRRRRHGGLVFAPAPRESRDQLRDNL